MSKLRKYFHLCKKLLKVEFKLNLIDRKKYAYIFIRINFNTRISKGEIYSRNDLANLYRMLLNIR